MLLDVRLVYREKGFCCAPAAVANNSALVLPSSAKSGKHTNRIFIRYCGSRASGDPVFEVAGAERTQYKKRGAVAAYTICSDKLFFLLTY